MDTTQLALKIQSLDGLTREEKDALLKLLRETPKYGLVWEDKPEAVEERLRDELPVLIEDESKRICPPRLSTDNQVVNNPNHIIIEGDNLEALTALSYTHAGKIDVIYIDPPYNTGNKDFVYNDSYVDAEDSYRHSKWLSFMSKRLRIAKKLLSDRGVIFISIDDNEQANLKLLCDDKSFFGERNFVAKFDWRKKTGANDAKDIAVITESVLCYAFNKPSTIENKIWNRDNGSRNEKRFKFSDEFVEERGKYYLDTLDRGGLSYSDSLNYGIEAPDGGVIYPNGRDKYVNDGWIWKWGKDKIKWGLENKFLQFVKSNKSVGSKYTIKYKVYEKVDNEGRVRNNIGRAFSNLILEPINQQGKSDITEVFNGVSPFSNPKPIGLVNYLLNTIIDKDISILDFFAGSGTTLHAVLSLNAKDGGHRQCILVTNNENGICENVTYERNKRVIEGYTKPNGEHVEGLHHNNLRYYRTAYVGRSRTMRNMRRLMDLSTDMLCIKEDLYAEKREFAGLRTHKGVFRFFDDSNRQMLVIYREEAVAVLVSRIAETHYPAPIKVYVFSPSEDPWEGDFEDVAQKVKLCALPQAIYNTYKRILPKPNDRADVPDDNSENQENLGGIFDTTQKGGEA